MRGGHRPSLIPFLLPEGAFAASCFCYSLFPYAISSILTWLTIGSHVSCPVRDLFEHGGHYHRPWSIPIEQEMHNFPSFTTSWCTDLGMATTLWSTGMVGVHATTDKEVASLPGSRMRQGWTGSKDKRFSIVAARTTVPTFLTAYYTQYTTAHCVRATIPGPLTNITRSRGRSRGRFSLHRRVNEEAKQYGGSWPGL